MTKPDSNPADFRERAYSNPDKVEHYEQWAPSYDADVKKSGYTAPKHAVDLLAKLVPSSGKIIEFGCGTGLVGEQLAAQNFQDVIGVDISPQMLAQAEARNCYQSLREHDLTQPLLDDVRYSAGICVGVCAFGPIMAEHLAHMTSVLVADAPLVVTINGRAWTEVDWAQQLEDAQGEYCLTIEYLNTIPYLTNENIDGKLLVIRNSEIESEATTTI